MDLWDGAFFLTQPILKILLLDRLQIRHRLVYDFTVCRCSFLPFVCSGLSVFIYPKYSDILNPYHTCSKIWTSTIYYPILWLKIAGWEANSVTPADETLHSAASHLGLHCLLRPVCVYPKYSDISTPYHTCSKILTSTIYYPILWLKIAGWVANSVDPDETLHSAASHLGLHCLLSPVCIYPKYSDTSTPYHTYSKIWTSTIYCNLMNVYCHVKGWTSSSKIRF